eukprot:s625_g5.t1
MDTGLTARETENLQAIGGMRNPQLSIQKIPGALERGQPIRLLLRKAQVVWPELQQPAEAILDGKEPMEFRKDVIDKIRNTILHTLWEVKPRGQRTARASTPIRADVIAGWKADPDAATLANWLDHGAPMGFQDGITCNGIFPKVSPQVAQMEAEQNHLESLEGWANYTSAEEENKDLQELVNDYVKRGFCHLSPSLEDATKELGRQPIVNKLGVIVKEKVEGDRASRKARIIWDLRRSGANQSCDQAERVLLPRLLDLVAGVLEGYRKSKPCWVAAIDIKDAFMNVPVMRDRYALVAAKPKSEDDHDWELIIFNTLVFGAASSPTIWGRFAAFLARTIAAVEPEVNCQLYVDDPAMVMKGDKQEAVLQLTTVLLWTAILGYPVKTSKASGGKTISWIGAEIALDDDNALVEVTIAQHKVDKLVETTDKFLAKPVVGVRELRSYVGTLSFIAGLIPHLRPFLASLWAVLPFGRCMADDGAPTKSTSGRLVHVRRIRPALRWIRTLLIGRGVPLRRQLKAFMPEIQVTITTDACPFGIGGTIRVSGNLLEAFSSDLPEYELKKFKAKRGESKHTTLWEAVALLVACRLWLPKFEGRARVHCKSDSLALLLSLVKGRAKAPDLAVVSREFSIDMARDKYRLHLLTHIPGITNLEADALSRVHAPHPPGLPRSLEGVPMAKVQLGPDFWTIDA